MAAFRWDAGAAPAAELRRIAVEQIDRGLGELDDDDRHRAVHKVRQRGKKVRALLRLVRPAAPELYQRENAAFRDMMRDISRVRDHGVAVETYDALLSRFAEDGMAEDGMAEELAPIRAALSARREQAIGDDLDGRLDAIRLQLDEARERVPEWQLDDDGFEVFEGGLATTYGRARARMDEAYADATSSTFHLWRKRAKYHRHHLRLLEAAWPAVLEARRREVHELTDLLGDDHDLAVLRADLVGDPDRFAGERQVGALCGLLDRRRAELQAAARPLGQRCFAEEPDGLVAGMRVWWRAASSTPGGGPLSDPTVVPGS